MLLIQVKARPFFPISLFLSLSLTPSLKFPDSDVDNRHNVDKNLDDTLNNNLDKKSILPVHHQLKLPILKAASTFAPTQGIIALVLVLSS